MSKHNETLDKIRLAVTKAHEMLEEAQEGEIPLEETQASISKAIQLIEQSLLRFIILPMGCGVTFKQSVIASDSSWPKHEAQFDRTGRDELVSQVLILRSLIGIFFLHRPFV